MADPGDLRLLTRRVDTVEIRLDLLDPIGTGRVVGPLLIAEIAHTQKGKKPRLQGFDIKITITVFGMVGGH